MIPSRSRAVAVLKALAVSLLCAVALSAHALLPVPPAGKRVTDLTSTLSPAETEQVSKDLQRIEKETKAQILVLIVDSLQDEPIDDFSMRVFDAWKPGKVGVNDGVIILLAKKERRMRIAVGRGLEGAIPDLAAKRVTSGKMVPAFKRGDFAVGFIDAANELERLIKVEQAAPGAAPSPAPVAASPDEESGLPVLALVFGIGGIAVVIWLLVRGVRVVAGTTAATDDVTERSRTAYERASPRRQAQREIFSSTPRPRSRSYSAGADASAGVFTTSSSRSTSTSSAPESSNSVTLGGGDSAGGGASDSY